MRDTATGGGINLNSDFFSVEIFFIPSVSCAYTAVDGHAPAAGRAIALVPLPQPLKVLPLAPVLRILPAVGPHSSSAEYYTPFDSSVDSH